jgi:hypothetical protein
MQLWSVANSNPARRQRARAPERPGWLRVAALVAANAVQVSLTWWILREAAAAPRRPSAGTAALRVAALVAANGLQVFLTWWLHRGPADAPRRAPSAPVDSPL